MSTDPSLPPDAEDYLWDGTGTPDPDIAHLESILSPHRCEPETSDAASWRATSDGERVGVWLVAIAAMLLVFVWLVVPLLKGSGVNSTNGIGWAIEVLDGAPTVRDADLDGTGSWHAGNWLETDIRSRARVQVADIGTLDIGPGSRIRLVRSGKKEHRVQLQRGRISAEVVVTTPRLFVVETPSATAFDLGCAYTLDVDDEGNARLDVTSGWVELDGSGRRSVVPAGAQCRTRAGHGPGTPYRTAASIALQEALAAFDFPSADALGSTAAVLRHTQPQDTVTLWHLIPRTAAADRQAVVTHLAKASPPPAGVTQSGVLDLDEDMLSAWWDDLN